MTEFRIESDSLGNMKVPANCYYGAQTQRAVENFPISDLRFPRRFIRALGLIKESAARANVELGLLDEGLGQTVCKAAAEVIDGKLDDQFVVDIFQTGSGTSTNMNTNEVIANRAIEITGGVIGSKSPIHPNDHVNYGQSSNDVIPTAIHVAAADALTNDLLPALTRLRDSLAQKAQDFDHVLKIGRTHLQDAVPIRLGQEFQGYAAQLTAGIQRIEYTLPHLQELAIGGTAVGTGLNTHPEFADKVCAFLSERTGITFSGAPSRFEALAARDAAVAASGAMRTVAVSLTKIANDIRWLGSGPRCGIGEILLAAVQPGSSIMPGKVNPVMSESMLMICAQVMGNDLTVAWGGAAGNFELNVMKPVIAHNLLESSRLLANGCDAFRTRCVDLLVANEERCNELIESSLAMCTALAPIIGYDDAAAIAKEAYKNGRTVREVAREKSGLSEEQLNDALDARRQTGK
ncbi:MAG TPA: class II fumarate hydratase [Myxococcales bacterium]|nr:class II fumarate hydratase [Myxococcales bacterium]